MKLQAKLPQKSVTVTLEIMPIEVEKDSDGNNHIYRMVYRNLTDPQITALTEITEHFANNGEVFANIV